MNAQATAQALASNTGQRVSALASYLEQAIRNPRLSDQQRGYAMNGMESLKLMVDGVTAATQDRRLGLGRTGNYTPATLKRLLAGWNQNLLSAETALRAASPAGFQQYAGAVMTHQGGMGIWSWNPNLWGLTADQAAAYQKAQAQSALDTAQIQAQTSVVQAQGDAAANAANPSMLSTASQAIQDATKTTTMLYSILGVGAVVGLGYWAYSEYKDSKGKKKKFSWA